MAWTRIQDGRKPHTESSIEMDSTRKEKEGTAQNHLAPNCDGGTEWEGTYMGTSPTHRQRQDTMERANRGLMSQTGRRGLSEWELTIRCRLASGNLPVYGSHLFMTNTFKTRQGFYQWMEIRLYCLWHSYELTTLERGVHTRPINL